MATANALISPVILPRRSRVYDQGHSSHSPLLVSAPETYKISLLHHGFTSEGVQSRFTRRSTCQASMDSTSVLGSSTMKEQGANYVPIPIVLIDQDSDSDATIVEVSFGDRLGALLDTMKALSDLGLDVAKGTVTTEASVTRTKFFITRLATRRKVEDPDTLERIRLTIINNLLKYHPESSERLAMGEAFGIKAPEKKLDVDIATHVHVKYDGPKRSLLYIETADRPGLLMEIIKILGDININVESAEIDTEGLVAKDKFHVSYRGAALNGSLSQGKAKILWQLSLLAGVRTIWCARNRWLFEGAKTELAYAVDSIRHHIATWAVSLKAFKDTKAVDIWRDASVFFV